MAFTVIQNPQDRDWYAQGVYQGQPPAHPIRIGSNFTAPTSHIAVGCDITDQSTLNLKAFYDPSYISGQQLERICFIQVGEFFINNIPMPVALHQSLPYYPIHDLINPPNTFFKWINIPEEYGSPAKTLTLPEYPLWSLLNNPGISHEHLHYYPQLYGSYTRQGSPTPMRNGEYLCAYLNLSMELNLGNLPCKEDGKTYFNSLIPNTFDNFHKLSDQIESEDGAVLLLQQKLAFSYKTEIKYRHADTTVHYMVVTDYNFLNDEFIYGVVWRPGNGTYFSYIDPNAIEEFDFQKRYYGEPDIEAIRRDIFNVFGLAPVFDSSNFALSYRFHTYACAADLSNNVYSIFILDGFGTELKREFNTVEKTWKPVTCLVSPLLAEQKAPLIQTLQVFMSQIHPNLVIKNP